PSSHTRNDGNSTLSEASSTASASTGSSLPGVMMQRTSGSSRSAASSHHRLACAVISALNNSSSATGSALILATSSSSIRTGSKAWRGNAAGRLAVVGQRHRQVVAVQPGRPELAVPQHGHQALPGEITAENQHVGLVHLGRGEELAEADLRSMQVGGEE